MIYTRFVSQFRPERAQKLELNQVCQGVANKKLKRKLADPIEGARIELRTKLGSAKRRKVPITLAGPKFID